MQAQEAVEREWPLGEEFTRRERGLWSDAFRRLIKNRMAMVALILLSVILVVSIAGNTFSSVQRYSPSEQDYNHVQEGPSSHNWFGTDNLGRDTWARVLEGTFISLQVGIGVAAIILVIGLFVGGAAALGGRTLDNVMMRITDLTYAFPDLLAIILIRAVFVDRDLPLVGHDASQRLLVIFAISFVAWVTVARLIRGQMLSLKERDFVIAARAMGASSFQIVFKHMLPNTLGPVIVAIVFAIPLAIFAEAVLGYIGIGLAPPTASLGRLINDGYAYIRTNIWLVFFPACTLALLMLCFTFLGDGLRDALDPRSR